MGKEIKTQTETPCNMIKKKKSPLYLDNFLETLKSQWTIIASFIEHTFMCNICDVECSVSKGPNALLHPKETVLKPTI